MKWLFKRTLFLHLQHGGASETPSEPERFPLWSEKTNCGIEGIPIYFFIFTPLFDYIV